MKENHQNEQYFFDDSTRSHLTNFLKNYDNPCLLCAPTIGKELTKQKIKCCILDIDNRFSELPRYNYFDIKKPKWIDETFGIIFCDPPFFNVSLSQLFKAVRLLSHNDYTQPILISYLTRRAKKFLKIFSTFNLFPMEYQPMYKSVKESEKNKIEFFGNLSKKKKKRLNTIY